MCDWTILSVRSHFSARNEDWDVPDERKCEVESYSVDLCQR